MRFKKLITPLLITVIICATLALGYQQDPLRLPSPFPGAGQTLPNSFSGAGQTHDQSAEVKDLYSRIKILASKVSLLEMRIEDLQNFAGTPCAPLRERLCVPEPDFQKPRGIPYQLDPLRLPNPFSGAGQTHDQSAEVKDLYSRIKILESNVSLLEKRIAYLQKPVFQKPRDISYQQDPLRLPNPFSGAGQTQKKDNQSAEVKELYSRITNLESKVSLLEMRIEDLQKPRVIPENQK
jgi:uncharacterized coiled-coil protein SlyX